MEEPWNFKQKLSKDLFFIRGCAIFSVVVGHVIGDRHSGIRQLYDQDIAEFSWLFSFIYTFHLPIFFILSGVSFAIFAKRDVPFLEFIQAKIGRLIVPLVCWAPLYCVFKSLSDKQTLTIYRLVDSILITDFVFWFFPALFFATVLAFIVLKLFHSPFLYQLVSTALLVLAFYMGGRFSVWFHFNIFYAFGFSIALVLPRISSLIAEASKRKILLVIFLTISVMILINSLVDFRYLSIGLSQYINGPLGFFLIYLVAIRGKLLFWFNGKMLLSIRNALIYLGKISMSIYLLHVLCASATRIFLVKLGVINLTIHFALGVSVAIMGPVLIHNFLAQRSKLYLISIGEAK